jgi:hypothetical protein
MLQSLLSQIVSELALRYPHASPEDIAGALIKSVETDILLNAIRVMKLPPPPSKMKILLEKKREERRKEKYRTSILEHRMKLTQDLEYLRHKLGHEEVDYPSVRPMLIDGDLDDFTKHRPSLLDASFARGYVERRDGVPLPKDLGFGRSGQRFKLEKSNPYTKGAFEKTMVVQFLIDHEIRDKISSDPLFMDVVRSIEVFVRNYAKHCPVTSSSISVKADPQILTWEKVIVRLTVSGLSLDQKMRLWDDVDVELRKTLHRLASTSDAQERSEIENVTRRLFTHVDL